MPNSTEDRVADPANFTNFTGVRLGWDTWSEVCELAGVGEPSDLKPTGVYVDQDGNPTSSFPGDRARIGLAFPPNDNGVTVAVEGDYLFREDDGTIYVGKIAHYPGKAGQITGQIRVSDSSCYGGWRWENPSYQQIQDVSASPPTHLLVDETLVPVEELKDRLGIASDWTCDSEGRSNSSVLFEDLITEVARILENNRANGSMGMARLLLAQLAHKHHLAPPEHSQVNEVRAMALALTDNLYGTADTSLPRNDASNVLQSFRNHRSWMAEGRE